MEYGDDGKLHIRQELRDELDRALLDIVSETVAAHEDRDRDCADCADYATGVAMSKYNPSWRGGSELVNPIIPKEITTLEASLVSPLMQQNIAQVSAKNDNDKTSAKTIEAWENDKAEEEDFPAAYHAYTHNMIVYPNAVIRMLWCDKTNTVTTTEYWDGESYDEDGEPLLIPDELRDPEVEYEEVDVSGEEVEKSGVMYDAVDPVNFYLIPPTAKSIETAYGTVERMVLSDSDLLAGIETYGYDKESVMDMIRMGGTLGENEYRESRNDLLGVSQSETSTAQGEYECFMYFGRLPYLWHDGEAKLPKRYWEKQFCVMLCPAHQIIFKMAESPYPELPYFRDSLFNGQGFVQRVMGLADSTTHYSRASEDILDIELSPVFAMDEESWEANKGFEFYPGARFVKTESGTIDPIPLPHNGLVALNMVQYLEGQIKDIAAAKGSGELQEKVRKNGEVAAMQQAVNTKFNLLAFVVYRNAPKIFRRRMQYQVLFGGGNDTTFVDGAETSVTEEDLKKAYRFSVAQTNADSSDESRTAKSQAILGLQTQLLQAKQAVAQGMMAPEDFELVYNAISDALPIYDVREPERVIGKKPELPPMGAMNPMMQGMAQNPMGQMMAGGMQGGVPADGGQMGVPAGFA